MKFKTIIEPFRIKMVEPIEMTTEQQRVALLKKAHYNPFLLEAKDVIIDLLTDSGTSAMSTKQWSGIMEGDESYAGAKSWHKMRIAVEDLTGLTHVFPTHQGRAAERILYGVLGGKNKVFISNTHFDTTRANIEFSGAEAIDIPVKEAYQPNSKNLFKGDMDTKNLEKIIAEKGRDTIAAVILTVTNNSGGGQPVSMQNALAIKKICNKNGILFVLDCCRIAENSYFIKKNEKKYHHISYKEIAQKMFSLCDAAVMSAKKDALVNMGGFLAMKNSRLAEQCKNLLIISEGFTTYGGLSGRDMEAIAIGLQEVFDEQYLEYRIKSTEYLGKKINNLGVPLLLPIGGHAVYVDAKRLYPHIRTDQYPGQSLVCELYRTGGIRSVEIGSVMFGKYDKNKKLIAAPMELVRLAIPRRVYTQSHIEYVIEVFKEIMKKKKQTKGYKITKEPHFLRHFTAHFEPLK